MRFYATDWQDSDSGAKQWTIAQTCFEATKFQVSTRKAFELFS